MANPFFIEPANPLQALMTGVQGYEGAAKRATEAETKAGRMEAMQALQSGGDLRSPLAKLIGIGDVKGAEAIAGFAKSQSENELAKSNADWNRTYQGGMLGIAQQQANRREEPDNVRAVRAAGIDPTSPAGQKALFPRTDTPISATDKKAIFEAEDALPQLTGTKESLARAAELNDKTFVGYFAGVRGDIGTKLPGGSALVDRTKALATSEWQKIMGPEALQAMASTLKGATTDFELRKFIEMLGDPATEPSVRKSVIKRMQALTDRKIEIQNSRVKDLRGQTYFKPDGGPSRSGTISPAIQQARDAIAQGAPRDAVINRLRENGIDTSGL